MSNKMIGIVIWAMVLAGGVIGQENGIVLSQDGQARAVIVVGAAAPVAEKHAAEDLAGILKSVTGATFEIQTQKPQQGSAIFVGKEAAKQATADFSTADLGLEGTAIVSRDGQLILTGDSPRGTLYAVYSFLEDVVGCRWWSSKAATIPQKATLKIAPMEARYAPPLEYRESFWFDAFDSDWSVRNKCNGQTHRLDENRGGHHQYYGFVHTFYTLIPPDKYFAEHPDWFSEIKGKRTHKDAQLCLTNAAMREELVRNLKAGLKANPAATIASVSQNDCGGNCQCAECARIDAEEGSPSGLLLRFVNAVAEDVCKEYPNVAIDTLAYQYTRKPPKITRPSDKVIVRLCSIECSFSVPLEDDRNATFRDDIAGWSKICNRLYIWDYVTNFAFYFRPHPNLRVLGPNIRFFVRNGVKGIFEQGAYTTPGADMAELRAWVLAKLLWNPNLDDRKLIREFIEGYYGPAGGEIEAYVNLIHDSIEKSGCYLGCYTGDEEAAKYLPFEVLTDGWKHLAAAEKAVQGNAELTNRVHMAQLPVLFSFLRDWKTYRSRAEQLKADWPIDPSPQAVYDRFVRVAKENQVTGLCEWKQNYELLDEALETAKK